MRNLQRATFHTFRSEFEEANHYQKEPFAYVGALEFYKVAKTAWDAIIWAKT
jgi:hypothetical protein